MPEYFVYANSFAAPFVSDDSTEFVTADTPQEALEKFAKIYQHPAGLYAAACYENADAYHKDKPALAKWLSNHAIKIQEAKPAGSYSYRGHGPGDFEINGQRIKVKNPKAGRVVE